jgi:hypothetical protein
MTKKTRRKGAKMIRKTKTRRRKRNEFPKEEKCCKTNKTKTKFVFMLLYGKNCFLFPY